jgi:hypothetical protein
MAVALRDAVFELISEFLALLFFPVLGFPCGYALNADYARLVSLGLLA